MARVIGAGDLLQFVSFEKFGPASDGYGGTTDAWVEQFRCRAAYTHLRGGEEVMGARLQGTHVQVITVRSSLNARSVTTEWRVRDRKSGDLFNIRDITPRAGGKMIDFLCQKGVPT